MDMSEDVLPIQFYFSTEYMYKILHYYVVF